ncbi:MAG: hypothetical protein ACYSTF_10225 [Planctomycetota bacterium]
MKFKQYALLFFGVGVGLVVFAIAVVPFWWLISRFFGWLEYWHVLLFGICNMSFIECYEWVRDYKEGKKPVNLWLIMLVFTLVYSIFGIVCYFVIRSLGLA